MADSRNQANIKLMTHSLINLLLRIVRTHACTRAPRAHATDPIPWPVASVGRSAGWSTGRSLAQPEPAVYRSVAVVASGSHWDDRGNKRSNHFGNVIRVTMSYGRHHATWVAALFLCDPPRRLHALR